MSAYLVLAVLIGYFGLLYIISLFTSRKSNLNTFFNANRRSPWYLVAYGMIGASLSGVTFISVPGWVKDNHFFYFQMVLGYLLGYFFIAYVLLPIYYKLDSVSIYSYLQKRFGVYSYKTGSAFFLISRLIGASFRLYLIVMVLQMFFFDKWNIPFALSIVITILLIWVYTHKAGIKTIVWTDTLQTTFMLLAVVISIIIIAKNLNLSVSQLFSVIKNHPYSQVFNFDWHNANFFPKSFLSGAFIALVMTGLDQDMMQKNLTVRTLRESRKNMIWFSFTLIPINLLFLSLGVLLYYYAAQKGIPLPDETDKVFPKLAIDYFGGAAAIVFLVGVIAAAFSSADSALTALTTAFCLDFLNINPDREDRYAIKMKNIVHIAVSIFVLVIILIFRQVNDRSVIAQIFQVAGYTYGPLLALFSFGLLNKRKIRDKWTPFIALFGIFISYIFKKEIEMHTSYKFGFEFLILNGAITYILLYLSSLGLSTVKKYKV